MNPSTCEITLWTAGSMPVHPLYSAESLNFYVGQFLPCCVLSQERLAHQPPQHSQLTSVERLVSGQVRDGPELRVVERMLALAVGGEGGLSQ
jgi:hypothetical protein